MSTDETPPDMMGYEALQDVALRGVIRGALERANAPGGLPGEHHFYISFRTRAPGVTIAPDLIARYPDEMTIVLQHQFWDLRPGEAGFSVTLQFGGQPKPLTIPYAAVTRFYDPAAPYMLQFSVPEPTPPAQADDPATEGPKIVSLDQFRRK